jgi:hypothetical protein
MPTPRFYLSVGVANRILYAVGGYVSEGKGVPSGEIPPSIMEAYDPRSNSWTKKTPLPGNRNFVALGEVSGILYAVGGIHYVPNGHDGPYSPMKRLDDPITYALKAAP